MPIFARLAVIALVAGLVAAPVQPAIAQENSTLKLIKKRIKDAYDDVVTGKVFEEALQQVRQAQRKHALKAAGYNKKLPYYVPDAKTPAKPQIALPETPPAKAKPKKKPVLASPRVRAEQKALNELGFDAGKADGLFGRRTANAIKRYQELIYHPVTGKLTAEERNMLLDAAKKKRQLAAVRKKEPGRGTLSYTVVNKSPSGLPPSPTATPRADREIKTGTTVVQKRSTAPAPASSSAPAAGNADGAKSQLPTYEEENTFDVDDPEG